MTLMHGSIRHAFVGAVVALALAAGLATHADAADPVQFGQVRQALEAPSASSHPEAEIPLLYPEQVETAPAAHLAEPVGPPRLVQEDGGRRVELWFQLEPGSRFELRTFHVAGDNSLTCSSRPGRER